MTRARRPARLLLALYSVLLAVVLFSPVSDRQSGAVVWFGHALIGMGLPERLVTFGRLEVILNVAIVAPVTLLASLVRPGLSWRDWTALGFLAAIGVELAQGLLLPDRQASFSDVVANTAGALIGAGVVGLPRAVSKQGAQVHGAP